jgi:hypothetical protein
LRFQALYAPRQFNYRCPGLSEDCGSVNKAIL